MVSPFNLPREIEARASEQGVPALVRLNRGWKKVVSVKNTWRIDDEWWREEIARLYFELELEGSLLITVFHDLASGRWYRQRC